MDHLMDYQYKSDDCTLDYEVLLPSDELLSEINGSEQDLEDLLVQLDGRISEKDKQIDKYTNDADKLCYMVAIGSGIVAGLVDILYVGSFDFDTAKTSVDKAFDDFVNNSAKNANIKDAVDEYKKKAKENGQAIDPKKIEEIKNNISNNFKNKKDKSASIRYLEKKFKIPSDSIWEGKGDGISAKSHHLDDLAHHPTVVGLFFSLLTQFMKKPKGFFVNSKGVRIAYDVENKELIGEGVKEKLIAGTINWIGHLISDMAGSSSSAKKGNAGMGLPGPIVSTLKEVSSLPILNKTGLPELANHLFTDDDAIFGKYRMDLRSELAIGKELSKQAVPVFINEILVRSFYFIRGLIVYCKNVHSIKDVPWNKVIPVGNRTIVRMMTISVGTMEVIDVAEAAIQGAIKASEASEAGAAVGSVGGPVGAAGGAAASGTVVFLKTFFLRINYVGIGRFVVAGAIDTSMGIKRGKLLNERIELYNQKLNLTNSMVMYKEAEMWISAEKAGKSVFEAYNMIDKAIGVVNESIEDINSNMDKISEYSSNLDSNNPGLKDDLLDTLKWG